MKLQSEFPNVSLKTDEGFRAFVQHVQHLMLSTDPTKVTLTSDTGQIDVMTVTTPAPATFPSYYRLYWSGFNIFRFNDGEGLDIYIKLQYGASNGNTSSTQWMQPHIRFSIGKGTDGEGNLTDIICPENQMKGYTSTTITSSRGVHYSYCCIKKGYLCLLVDVGGQGATFPTADYTCESNTLIISKESGGTTLSITKSNDSSSSTPSNTEKYRDCVTMVTDIYNPASVNQTFFSQIVQDLPSIGNSGLHGGDVYLRPVEVLGKDGVYVDENLVAYFQNDFSNGSEHEVEMNGVMGNFLFLTPALRTTAPHYTNLAVRWE